MSDMTPDQLVKTYINIRDKLKEDESNFKTHKAKMQSYLDVLESRLKSVLANQKVNSVRTDHGTAYKDKKEYVSVADWEQFLGFLAESCAKAVGAKEPKELKYFKERILSDAAWHFLNRAVNKSAILQYIKEAEGALPSGIKYESENVVKIRK